MEFTPWSLLVDAGLIGLLLAVGTLLRAVIRPLQALMVPASVLGGFIGLALGPHGLGVLPFSDQLGTYASVLIVVVFACVAMTDDFDLRKIGRGVASFASYGVLVYAVQVALGMLFVLLLLQPLFGVPDSFGALLFAGWAGGFGTAAAMGAAFQEGGDPTMMSLAYTSATVGMLAGIVGGIIQARIGARRGWAREFAGLHAIPRDLRTGLLDPSGRRPAIGTHTFSAASIESLAFHVGIIGAVGAAAYGVSVWLGGVLPDVAFPVFSIAFIVGLVVRALMTATRASRFVDTPSLQSLSGTATDFLILCGIASIVPSVVADNWLPLLLLFVFGLVVCLALGLRVAPRLLRDGWFEKQLFTWGWATGAVATGIAMLRIVDPKLRSGTMEEFGVAYIPVVPVEIAAVTFVPTLVVAGAAWSVVGIWGAVAVVAAVVAVYLVRTGGRTGAGEPARQPADAVS
ncbi:sodium:glutamate symporter [Citricoccus sp. SGAir0253]|uniref:sodium/glutamate symporter n=1 Tax=Citricoccus sp. SGAir0253 TaxID=2567881 RepID=UPI0010CD3425|nr:sodium:glutamate symporter [Citricoccus sp. SGAir0253]QCU78280.1 sodium:glutamate symporter [Citricoccus sp. SGAir0253]